MGGVDPLISYFVSLEMLIVEQRHAGQLSLQNTIPRSVDELSSEVITKLQIILQSRIFFVSAVFIQRVAMVKDAHEILEGRALKECLRLAKQYNAILNDLRMELLKIKLNHKTDIYNLAANKAVAHIVDRMNAKHIQTVERLGIEFKRDEKGHLLMELE